MVRAWGSGVGEKVGGARVEESKNNKTYIHSMSVYMDKKVQYIKLETRKVAALPWCWNCKRWAGRREGGNYPVGDGRLYKCIMYYVVCMLDAYAVCSVFF